jgi:SAM-dependent methyltransferase
VTLVLNAVATETEAVPPAVATERIRAAFERSLRAQNPTEGELDWRMSRFDRGLKLAAELRRILGPLRGTRIADLGAAHGGDVCALISAGGQAIAVDYRDYGYGKLQRNVAEAGFSISAVIASAMASMPFKDGSFQVIVAINLIEHLPDTRRFFAEVGRLLTPGGVALVSVPVCWKGALADPHFGTPLTALLPMPIKRWVCQRVLRRDYPFALGGATYYSSARIVRAARRSGMKADPRKFSNSPLVGRVRSWPGGRVWEYIVRRYLFDFVVLRKQGVYKDP